MSLHNGRAVALSAIFFALSAGPLQAQVTVTNGGFETGNFNGWATIGVQPPTVVTNIGGTIKPDTGCYFAYVLSGDFNASPDTAPAAVAAFCNVPLANFNALFAAPSLAASRGSAISQNVTVTAGATLTFRYNFCTQETPIPNTIENDSAFFSVSGGAVKQVILLGNTASALVAAPAPFNLNPGDGQTGWKTGNYTFAAAGVYTIAFSVFDSGDFLFPSAILVDTVGGPGVILCGAPVPTTPSSPVPSGAEGSFVGVHPFSSDAPGLTGSEGSFGFGAHVMASDTLAAVPPRPPFLNGPLLERPDSAGLALVSTSYASAPPADSHMRVFNATYRQRAWAALAVDGSGSNAALPWVLITLLSVGAAAALLQTLKGTLAISGGHPPV